MSVNDPGWDRLKIMSGARLAAVAGLSATFFFDEPARAIASRVADAIEAYVGAVGLDRLKWYLTESGFWRPMTASKLKRDLRILRAFAPEDDFFGLEYQCDCDASPESFGIELEASDLRSDVDLMCANYLRFDFPPDWHLRLGVETFLTFVGGILETLRPSSAQVCLGFKRMPGRRDLATVGVNRLLSRYIAFDPGYSRILRMMRRSTFTAHWLTFLDNGLVQRLGSRDAVEAALPGCELRILDGGILIRGAKLPPMGDVNGGATDLGSLPDVARLLKPTRAPIRAFGSADFDASAWLARLDSLQTRPWDNANVG